MHRGDVSSMFVILGWPAVAPYFDGKTIRHNQNAYPCVVQSSHRGDDVPRGRGHEPLQYSVVLTPELLGVHSRHVGTA